MDYAEVVSSLNADVVARLREAVATGRWPDGREVTAEQREHSLQAVLAWEAVNLPPQERVGFIDKGRKGSPGDAAENTTDTSALRWAEDK